MKLRARDLAATILVAAIAVPYIGYLIRGEMPFVKDPRGMSAIGLVLGVVAFLVIRSGDSLNDLGKAEIALAAVSLALGIAALIWAEAAMAELLLAVFMVSLVVVWAVELMDHAGMFRTHSHAAARR